MPDVKQYGLKGVGTDVQFGKSSGRLKYSTDHFEARDATDSAFVRIGGLDPVNDTDLATKKYVDLAAAGISYKDAVRVATNSLITGLDDGITGIFFGKTSSSIAMYDMIINKVSFHTVLRQL